MNVTCIMATCGRHKLAERSLRFFLDQDYEGEHTLLIFNNSDIEQKVYTDEYVRPNKHVVLVNQHIDSQTDKTYTNLGAIYNDALIHELNLVKADVITHWDDDDIFLPDHISEGVKGLKNAPAGTLAYKPAKSYYRHAGGIEQMSNTLEPSMFVEAEHIREYRYSLETTPQHLQWVNPLVSKGKIYIDEKGKPTLIYNWGDVEIPTFKTSGDGGNPKNFLNYRNFSRDHGDGIIVPWSKESVEKYYKLV